MGKIARYVMLVSLVASSQAAALPDSNPFAKMDHVEAGSSVAWKQQGDEIAKIAVADDGTWYRFSVDRSVLRLRMTEAGGARPKSYDNLAIEDFSIDGRRSAVFQWCLGNQTSHNRFLEQGQTVARGICVNDGTRGEFIIQLTQQTFDALKGAGNVSFQIKPFRKSVKISFDMGGFDDRLTALLAPKQPPAAVATPAVVKPAPKVQKMCSAKAPADLRKIKPVSYACDDAAARQRAESSIAAAVKMEKERIAAAEARRKAELAEQKRLEAEALKAKQEEEAAIAASQSQGQAVLDAFTKKMVGVCSKLWDKGEHRCYCDKYLEHAPAEIQSKSCS